MISMKMQNIVELVPVFQQLLTQNFSAATALKIARLVRELNKELETYETARNKIINKYCIRDVDGDLVQDNKGNYKVDEDNIKQCNEEMSELLNMQIDINASKLNIENFDGLNLSPSVMLKLDCVIE